VGLPHEAAIAILRKLKHNLRRMLLTAVFAVP